MLADHYLSNLELAQFRYRKERIQLVEQTQTTSQVMVVGGELSHNAAGRAHTLLLTYQQLGYTPELLGCHFPLRSRPPVLWEPLQNLELDVHTFVVNDHSQFFWQAWELVLQHPADLVHLSKPRLPAVLFGLLYKLLWGAAVLMDIDDEELCFVGESEPISVDALKRQEGKLPPAADLMGPLWTRLAVDLGQRFDGITVANKALQQRYGGTVIPHGRDPEQLRPATTIKRSFARRRFGIAEQARVVLFLGTPRRHKGLLEVAAAVAALPEELQPLFVVAGSIPDTKLKQELVALLPPERLKLLGNQPFGRARDILALADLEVLLSSGEVATFQSPAKLSDALAMGLPVLVSDAAPLQEAVERGWAVRAEPERLAEQLQEWLEDPEALARQGKQARAGFLETLALPVVAERLANCAAAALAAPGPVDGQQLTLLESLAPELASPWMARRYEQWSEQQLNWAALQQQGRDPELVSVVVPVYGDPAELDGCLQAVRQAHGSSRWELIAVMNDASPESEAVLVKHQQADARIRAVRPGENVMFALGCNLGFAASAGTQVVFLNNDCRVQSGWLEALLAPLADPEVAAVQPRLLKPDGTVQCLGVVFRDGQTLGYPLYAGLDGQLACTNQEHRLQAVTGACVALRAADFASVRGFDAGFLNSQEDVDLCLRLLRLPERKVCVSTPATTVLHSESVAPGRFRHTRWSRKRFVQRWRSQVKSDDEAIYTADGIVVASWKEDSESLLWEGIGAGRAVLQPPNKQIKAAIVVHIFYLNLWPEISRYLSESPAHIDLHITCCPEQCIDVSGLVRTDFPAAEIHTFPNEGMDVLPFLRLLPELKRRGYDVVCKLHTKRGVEPLGAVWRRHLLRSLVGSASSIQILMAAFNDMPRLALAGPAALYVSGKALMYENKPLLKLMHNQLDPDNSFPEDWGFFAGSMFWARISWLLPIAAIASQVASVNMRDREPLANDDGGLAHALERAFGWAAHNHQAALIGCVEHLKEADNSQNFKVKVIEKQGLVDHAQHSHLSQILRQLIKPYQEL